MQQSSYPSVRKLYAAIRAVDQLTYAYGTNVMSMPVLHQIQPLLAQNLYPTIQDKTTPPEEAYEACKEALKELNGNPSVYAQGYSSLEPIIFTNWPNQSPSWLLKGEAYLQMAWNARGGGYANKVSQAGWKAFAEKLSVAEEALKKAWELDPKDSRIPTLMIRVDEGQQKPRDDMELWFSRAMALSPNNYDACKNKLHYLYPQWYGSREDMIAFGKECVSSTNWGGLVPITLVDAHFDFATYSLDTDEARQAYWKRPDVWPDIKAAYDRYFALNPKESDLYKNYASFAYKAEQWRAFLDLAQRVRPIDLNFFGGKDELDKMVRFAKDHVK